VIHQTNCVLTIGKFEGIHLGHISLLAEVKQQASLLNLASAVMVFEPHPYIFLKDANYKPLFTKIERDCLLANTGLSHIFYRQFDKNFASLPPKDFCRILFVECRAKLVIVGENYRFGKNRIGDIEFLRNEASSYGAMVKAVALHKLDNIIEKPLPISTSNIRKLLREGNLTEANNQLGFPFFIMGIVAKGKQLGRSLGFPTLNMYPSEHKFLPPNGVYKTQTKINNTTFRSITNVGLCPTIDTTSSMHSVETHLLDYEGNELYGNQIKVELLEFIRTERQFNSRDELKSQITLDVLYSQRG